MFGINLRRSGSRRVRTPVFPQMEVAECGAASLGAVLAYYGRWESLENLREACRVGRDGSSAADIVAAAKRYGLRATGWSKSLDELRDVALPAILFWEFNHFLVLEGFGKGKYYLNDPALGRRVVSEQTFSEGFTGILLIVEPEPEFRRAGAPPSAMRRLWPWLLEDKRPLAFAILCGLLLTIPSLAPPFLISAFVDYVLIAEERQWAVRLVAAMALAGCALYLLTWLQQLSLRRLAVRLSVVHADRMLARLFRLSASYFAQRYAGDLTQRAQIVDKVAATASRQFVGIVIELATSLVFLAAMVVFDPLMALVVAALGAANLALTRVVSTMRNDQNAQLQKEQALYFGIGAFGLRDIDSLRATARQEDFFARLSGYQARELVARQRFVELGYIILALPRIFSVLGSTAVIGLGAWRMLSGDITPGEMMGLYMLAANFLLPIGRFVQYADAFQVLAADLKRIDDIMNAPESPALAGRDDGNSGRVATLNGRLRLAGRLELREVTFGYNASRPPLIENFSLTVAPGQRVAVIGPTGSGKSTLLKLMSGEYSPWSGQILLDDVPIDRIPRKVLIDSVSFVDQDVFLFAATVRDNLTLWNPDVPDQDLATAARDALVHEDIMSRPLGYDSAVEEGGRNFSGGQRQRLEIARALAKNPSLLCMDEATSSLDAVSELRIDDALRRRGCTCLIIAHRLSSIRDCDQIIVLERGRESQRGTHEELLSDQSGAYYRLVQSE